MVLNCNKKVILCYFVVHYYVYGSMNISRALINTIFGMFLDADGWGSEKQLLWWQMLLFVQYFFVRFTMFYFQRIWQHSFHFFYYNLLYLKKDWFEQ